MNAQLISVGNYPDLFYREYKENLPRGSGVLAKTQEKMTYSKILGKRKA
jgi:hypothetical protein